MSADNGRLSKATRMDRRSVRYDLPAAAAVDRLVESGEYASFSAFMREALDEKLAREVRN